MKIIPNFHNFDDLAIRLGASEVDGGTHAGSPEVVCLLDRAKHDLGGGGGIGQQLVVVDLDDERQPVRILA